MWGACRVIPSSSETDVWTLSMLAVVVAATDGWSVWVFGGEETALRTPSTNIGSMWFIRIRMSLCLRL